MDTSYSNLLFHTAFCCMTCDGDIDPSEVTLLNTICAKSSLFESFDFQTEVNQFVEKLNKKGKVFFKEYFDVLENSSLTEDEELQIIDIAIQTIKADEKIVPAEKMFFKNIRHRLKVSDEKISEKFPDFELLLSFGNLLFRTGFCCMTCDDDIDDKEVALLKSTCTASPLFQNFDFLTEVNILHTQYKELGETFFNEYLDLLENSSLKEDEEFELIDFAIQVIKADNIIKYSEIKFFKKIRCRLKIRDEKILERHRDFEQYLEADIVTESLLDRITRQFFDFAELPQFNTISF